MVVCLSEVEDLVDVVETDELVCEVVEPNEEEEDGVVVGAVEDEDEEPPSVVVADELPGVVELPASLLVEDELELLPRPRSDNAPDTAEPAIPSLL